MWKDSEVPFVKCTNCGLVYQNPQPAFEELIQRYDGEYFDYEIENRENFFNLMKLGLSDAGFFGIEKRFFQDGDNSENPVFLDVGCATGRLLLFMRERGWNVKGAEVCRPAAMHGIEKHGLDIHIGPVETAGLADSSVDVFHCSHLVEHLTEPSRFTAEAARILKPGGIFITVTPDVSGFQARLFKSEWRSAIADHMYLFSKKTLKTMLKNSGFRILKTVSWGGLAAGTAPPALKRTADRLAKRLGAGDVVCIMSMLKP